MLKRSSIWDKTYLFASHFWVIWNAKLKPEFLERRDTVKHPSLSVIPHNKKSVNVGKIQHAIGKIAGRVFFIILSLKAEIKIKNLAFLVGKNHITVEE